MENRKFLDEWDAAIEKARAELARAIEARDTSEHPEAVKRYETARDEVDRIARDALLGERES